MVSLTTIYTKTGDDGTTGLGDGTRVAKYDLRVTAYGEVDELNAFLGQLSLRLAGTAFEADITRIMNDLFDLGADLCVPNTADEKPNEKLRVTRQQVTWLEGRIDAINSKLQPLKSFILPTGSMASSWCHLCRTICRRAERAVATLADQLSALDINQRLAERDAHRSELQQTADGGVVRADAESILNETLDLDINALSDPDLQVEQTIDMPLHAPINPAILIYLNRLSDYLFVLARACNEWGKNDVLWVPGASR